MISKLPEQVWQEVISYTRQQFLAKYDPTAIVADGGNLSSKLDIPHKGFYLTVDNSSNEEIVQIGFLQEDLTNVFDSLNKTIEAVYTELKSKSIAINAIQTGTIHLTTVLDVQFIENGLDWDVNENGIYFNWGDRYKGLYLPCQIKKMAVRKHEIMNRLCSYQCSIASNLWRLPEGVCHRLICDNSSG